MRVFVSCLYCCTRPCALSYNAGTQVAAPGDGSEQLQAANTLSQRLAKVKAEAGGRDTAETKVLGSQIAALKKLAASARTSASASPVVSVYVAARHHFASALQRMSVIATVRTRGGTTGALSSGTYALVKGSPEKLRDLLTPGSEPAWFASTYVVAFCTVPPFCCLGGLVALVVCLLLSLLLLLLVCCCCVLAVATSRLLLCGLVVGV